jgi:hypothetical protein
VGVPGSSEDIVADGAAEMSTDVVSIGAGVSETGDDGSTETSTAVLSVGLPEIAGDGSILIAIKVASVRVGILDSSDEMDVDDVTEAVYVGVIVLDFSDDIVAEGGIEMSTDLVSVGAGVSETGDDGSTKKSLDDMTVGTGESMPVGESVPADSGPETTKDGSEINVGEGALALVGRSVKGLITNSVGVGVSMVGVFGGADSISLV